MEWLTDPEALIALATLTIMEIVLGIDNIVFISILAGKLPKEQQEKARKIGLLMAMFGRIGLLLCITWVMRLKGEWFPVFGHSITGKDFILIAGGLFLVAKSTLEIHGKLEGEKADTTSKRVVTFGSVIIQILILDLVFSLDSIITAVGMAKHIEIMVIAVILAVLVMMAASGAISRFIEKHPTVKMLALSFLLLIGAVLVGEGLGQHIPKGYIYFAMAFSVMVEMLNLKLRSRSEDPLKLRRPRLERALDASEDA